MIKSFRHKGLRIFFLTGNASGIQVIHADRLSRQLARLNIAKCVEDMNIPGWKLHSLSGKLSKHYSISVSGNWRVTFCFDGEDVILVNYQDYH